MYLYGLNKALKSAVSTKRTNHKEYLSSSGVLNHRPEEKHGELRGETWREVGGVSSQGYQESDKMEKRNPSYCEWNTCDFSSVTPKPHSIRTITKFSPLGEAEISISPGKAIFLQGTPATETRMNNTLGHAISKQVGHQGRDGSWRKTMK